MINLFVQHLGRRLATILVPVCLLASLSASAESESQSQSQRQSLSDLYDRVSSSASGENQLNSEREAKFVSSAAEKRRLLAEVTARINEEERSKTRLKKTFDDNEDELAELSTALDRRIGDLGELFGVFRQTADDTQGLLLDSLVSLEYPERRETVQALAQSTEVPTIEEMRALWQLLIQEIAESGRVTKFEQEVISPSGEVRVAEVVRVGTFNAIAGDKYLTPLIDENTLSELPRQPVSYARSSAMTLSEASDEATTFSLDPSRGALLGLLVQTPSLMERVQQGKVIGFIIIFGTLVGLLLVLERWMRLARIEGRIKRQLGDMGSVLDDNPVGRVLGAYYENMHLQDLETISRKMEAVIVKDVSAITRGLPIIKVLATVAPLTGLLGTVVGMIETFQSITLFGTGDPKLMAGGISMALITTVLGLVAAIPLLISHTFLTSKAGLLSKIIGEQAAGLVATKAEELAAEKLERADRG